MFLYVAHAGETHQTAAEATAHNLATLWYVALPAFVVAVLAVAVVVYFVSGKSRSATDLAILASLLIGGIATYSVAPVISTMALAIGFCLSLLQVLFGLSKPGRRHKD